MTGSNNYQSAIKALPGSPLFRGDERITPYSGDVILSSDPDAVIRARDVQDISEVLAYCHAHHLPHTGSARAGGLDSPVPALPKEVSSSQLNRRHALSIWERQRPDDPMLLRKMEFCWAI